MRIFAKNNSEVSYKFKLYYQECKTPLPLSVNQKMFIYALYAL